jgi:hypothetical protein
MKRAMLVIAFSALAMPSVAYADPGGNGLGHLSKGSVAAACSVSPGGLSGVGLGVCTAITHGNGNPQARLPNPPSGVTPGFGTATAPGQQKKQP